MNFLCNFVSAIRRTGSGTLLVLILGACAGPEKAKIPDLGPNTALIGIRLAWSSAVGEIAFPMHVQVQDDVLIAASSQGVVAAIDSRTGGDVWRVTLGTALSAGVGADGRFVSVVSRENELITLRSGREIWRQPLTSVTFTAPLVAGDRVFNISADRTVSAWDAATGRKLWQQQRNGDALILGQSGVLTAVGDTLVAGFGGRLVGMNPNNGSIRWEAAIANSRGTNEVERLVDLVAGNSRDGSQVCVRAFQSAVGCVDAATGVVMWTKPATGSTGVHGDTDLLVGSESDGKLRVWRRTSGDVAWTSERLRFRSLGTPLIVGRSVAVGDSEGVLHFLSREDGEPLNRLGTDGSAIVAGPHLVGQTVVAVTKRGGIYGFRPE